MTHNRSVGRRELLKLLTASSGAIIASSLVPAKWRRPEVQIGVLPAHAQVSQPGLTVLASWEMNGAVIDVDLMVWDPGGSGEQVDWTNRFGPTATHSGDNIDFDPARNWERVTVPTGGAADGVYRVWVHAHEESSVEVTVEITAAGSKTFTVTAPANVVNAPVAQITYPGGIITPWLGPVEITAGSVEHK